MREFYTYINTPGGDSVELLKIAVSHHRFVWIHPFGNGNGRTVRLLTYAMLCKKDYITANATRLFNPTAVFACNRKKYYDMLNLADDGKPEHILSWCSYLLDGIKLEIEKAQKLTDGEFVKDELLLPAVELLSKSGVISKLDGEILWRAVRKESIKAGDIADLWDKNVSHTAVTKAISKLRGQNYLQPIKEGGREYIIRLTGNKMTRLVLDRMDANGFLPIHVDETSHAS